MEELKKKFDHGFVFPNNPRHVILIYVADWTQANIEKTRKPTRSLAALSWQLPNERVIKINTNRCRKGEDGRNADVGVLRDSYGQWICFAANLGVGQVLEAELWGIYLGLKIAWDIGCSAVVLESDSAIAVHLLNKNVEDLHPLAAMLWGCQDYINKNWVCNFINHVYRECNMVADKLAKLGSYLQLGLSTFHDPPNSIRSFLSDLLGVCRPRAIV
ncbi:unnamed protein product [Prunus armeniaca]